MKVEQKELDVFLITLSKAELERIKAMAIKKNCNVSNIVVWLVHAGLDSFYSLLTGKER